MEYFLPNISCRSNVSEPVILYESDLVKQWLNISPGTSINTANSGNITVINIGKRNKHEGPDIKDAILIINDQVVNGPIECHISTSDWYRHNHHKNSAYKSVILHVVRKFNDGIITPSIPTILLKPAINYSNECSLNNINKSAHIINTILYNSRNRWVEKINIYNGYHDNRKQLNKLLLRNSFRILGAGGNEQQFVELSNNIYYEKFLYLTKQEGESYLWEISLQLKISWVKRGIRPAQQPQNRMKLAVELIHYFSNLDFSKYLTHTDLKTLFITNCLSASGIGIQTELLGNIVIPFFAARSLYLNKIEEYQDFYESWNRLKIPSIYRKFAKRFGTIVQSSQLKSFSILQGLIAIDANWCGKNLCHICPLKEKYYVNT